MEEVKMQKTDRKPQELDALLEGFARRAEENLRRISEQPKREGPKPQGANFAGAYANFVQFLEGAGLQVDSDNEHVVRALVAYMIGDGEKLASAPCLNGPPDLRRGIALIGNVGTGKSWLLNLWGEFCRNTPGLRGFRSQPARWIAREFQKSGFEGLDQYGKRCFGSTPTEAGGKGRGRPITYMIDDIGTEPEITHYGTKVDPIGEVLQDRYDLMLSHGMTTHMTSNLTRAELKATYGERVSSRMGQMFNFFLVGGPSRRPGQI